MIIIITIIIMIKIVMIIIIIVVIIIIILSLLLFVLYSRFGVLEASCGRVTLDGRLDEPVPIDKQKGTYGCPRDKTVRLSQIHLKTVNNGNIYHNNNKQPGHYQ